MRYHGTHAKESSKHLQAGSVDGIFFLGSTAQIAASLCGVNRKTAGFFFLRLGEVIVGELVAEGNGVRKPSFLKDVCTNADTE